MLRACGYAWCLTLCVVWPDTLPCLCCSPAAQATYAQLKILTELQQSVVRLASSPSQPFLFQPPPTSLQVLLQRSSSTPGVLGGLAAPQLTVLPDINIQVSLLQICRLQVALFAYDSVSCGVIYRSPNSLV